jgi:hypothetical protein
VGRYRGGNVAAIDSSGDLEALSILAITGSYQHHWSDQLRSNVTYAWAGGDPPSTVPSGTAERVDYLAVNLIWQFHERAWTGVEYLHGTIDTVAHDHGADHRLQFAIRFDL